MSTVLTQVDLYIKSLSEDDIQKLRESSHEIFIPNFDDPLVVVSGGVFDSSDNLLGAGFIRLVSEATIWLNPSIEKRTKIKVLYELFREGKKRSVLSGLDKIVAFTDNVLYAKALKKHLGFNDKSGIGLQVEI